MKGGKMGKKIIFYSICAMVAACMSCGKPEPKNVSFAGSWKMIFENAISGDTEERTVSVITDGNRFRLEDELSIKVFDGNVLYTKSKPSTFEDTTSGYQPDPRWFETRQQEITPVQANQLKFWLKSGGKKQGPGGNIAGQETVLYQAGVNRPDAQIALQYWIDAETGVVLKSVHSIYSKQVEQLVSRETTECIQIDYYALVDDQSFTKP